MTPSAAEPEEDRRMHPIYGLVIACHAGVIAALWLFGRVFSS
jgi:hypothetical protein